MQICVAGWYGHEGLYNDLMQVDFDVTVVSHREGLNYQGLEHIEIENVGLEFGAYNYFVEECWDGVSPVLFMHDDFHLEHLDGFDEISRLTHDCAYIFRDKAEREANGGKHGRAIYCSERFLTFVSEYPCACEWCVEKEDIRHNPGKVLPALGYNGAHKGFWYDSNNTGHVSGRVPKGVRHYNSGIEHFHWFLGRVRDRRCGDVAEHPKPEVKMDVINRILVDGMIAGRRNQWTHVARETKRYGIDE